MSRTDISAASLADYLRRKAGDGGIEWCYEPMQTSVLLDMADMLDENAKLRELAQGIGYLLFAIDADYCVACPRDSISHPCPVYTVKGGECLYKTDLRELGVEV